MAEQNQVFFPFRGTPLPTLLLCAESQVLKVPTLVDDDSLLVLVSLWRVFHFFFKLPIGSRFIFIRV